MEVDILEAAKGSSILRNCLKSVPVGVLPGKPKNSGIFPGLQCSIEFGCRRIPLDQFGAPRKNSMETLKNVVTADSLPYMGNNTHLSMTGTAGGLVQDRETMTEEIGSQTEQDQIHPSPCDPGTFLYLEGVVWHETQDGVLVVNITWRGRNYVGTLLDHTRYDWAGTSYTDASEEKRSSKARGVSYSNSSNGYSPNTGVGKRNTAVNSGPYNSVPAANSSSAGGRTTNNSIAAEYDANSKIRVHAVSPLVGCQPGQTGVYPNGATTPSQPVTASFSTGKAKRACNMSGSRTPPPLNIVEDQGIGVLGSVSGSSSSGSGGNLKRKSEKNSSGDQGGVSENKTGKKPRVTITNIGANNETLTTVLNTTLPCDNLWKCSEPSCSKKYKHKNGLRYHITHAHNKSEAEADVIIENEMTSHYSQITIASNTESSSANGDEDGADGSKMTSPNSTKGNGKKTAGSRKATVAKEKKKRMESDDSPPSNSELGSSHGSNDSSELTSGNGSSNSTPPITCTSNPSTAATVKSSVSATSNVKETTLVPKTPPTSSGKISRLGGASSGLPLQPTDPAMQPERKVAKVAPTSFGGGSDSSKYKNCNNKTTQHLESNVKLEPSMMGPSSSKSYKTQNSHFHVQTPIYPFGPVDPKLYTNFVAPSYAAHAHGGDPGAMQGPTNPSMGLASSDPHNSNASPKPEGTAARIVHQQHPSGVPISHHQGSAVGPPPSGNHGNQTWAVSGGGYMQQGSTGVHHITTTVAAANNGAHANWKPPDVTNSFVDNAATKFVEANAQHIAEATVQAVSTHHQQLQAPPASPGTMSTATIASHHVHNHIHNYVGFPPPAQMTLPPGHPSANQNQPPPPPGPQNPQSPQASNNPIGNPANVQPIPKQPNTKVHLPSPQQKATAASTGVLCNMTGQMAPANGQAVSNTVANTNIGASNSNQTQPTTTSSSSPQFASIVQGRPLAPVSPFNTARAGQS